MTKRKRVSRPHPQPEPPRRLVTKARKQEWDEARSTGTVGADVAKVLTALKAPKAKAVPAPTKKSPSEKRSLADSPDLLALLTGAKTTNKPAPKR